MRLLSIVRARVPTARLDFRVNEAMLWPLWRGCVNGWVRLETWEYNSLARIGPRWIHMYLPTWKLRIARPCASKQWVDESNGIADAARTLAVVCGLAHTRCRRRARRHRLGRGRGGAVYLGRLPISSCLPAERFLWRCGWKARAARPLGRPRRLHNPSTICFETAAPPWACA